MLSLDLLDSRASVSFREYPGTAGDQPSSDGRHSLATASLVVDLSVVFINYRSTVLLDGALSSLRAAAGRLTVEVTIVDNHSECTSSLLDLARRYGAGLSVLNRNLGYGAAANRAFPATTGRYVAVANPDLVFAPGALEELVRVLDATPEAGAISPQFYYPDGLPQPSARRIPRFRFIFAGRRSPLVRVFPRLGGSFLYSDTYLATQPVPVEAVIGAFVVFRRQAFQDVGGFDERFFMFAEDVDICQRLDVRGWKSYVVPTARVEHLYGGVRRRYRRFTEYHRIRALCILLGRSRGPIARALLSLAGTGYLAVLEAAWLLGMGEHERSWRRRSGSA